MRLAIYQGAGSFCNPVQNLNLLSELAIAAASKGANFLILSELFLTGYNIGDEAKRLAEPYDGKSLQVVAHIAAEHQLAILIGYIESSQGALYNSAALIDATGNLLGNYRKIHLFGDNERRLFTPGDQWVIQEISGFKVGVLICFDVEFPEAVRTLALKGADLIAVPTAIAFPYTQIPKLVVPTRALENQLFIAYVNRIGSEHDLEYCGLSAIAAPNGKLIIQAGEEEALLIAELDLTAISKERSEYCYINECRLELYTH